MKKKIVYIGFAFSHHKNTHGGYHHIAEYLKYDEVIDVQSWFESRFHNSTSLPYRIVRKILRILIGEADIPFYLLRILWISLFNRHVTFHIIYGENIMHRWIWSCAMGNKVVCTLHQPYEWFASQPIWHKHLKKMDSIILMSDEEIPLFEQLTGKKNVTFIPHGIDTDFYKPDFHKRGGETILMVGNWLRDFNMADAVFKELLSKRTSLQIKVVTNRDNFDKFTPHARLHLLTQITDEQLRNLYQECSVMFLPLKAYTANNALLEAAATGCRIVIASNQINDSYFTQDQISMIPLDINYDIEFLKTLLDRLHDEQKELNNRSFVINEFSWQVIAKKTEQIVQ